MADRISGISSTEKPPSNTPPKNDKNEKLNSNKDKSQEGKEKQPSPDKEKEKEKEAIHDFSQFGNSKAPKNEVWSSDNWVDWSKNQNFNVGFDSAKGNNNQNCGNQNFNVGFDNAKGNNNQNVEKNFNNPFEEKKTEQNPNPFKNVENLKMNLPPPEKKKELKDFKNSFETDFFAAGLKNKEIKSANPFEQKTQAPQLQKPTSKVEDLLTFEEKTDLNVNPNENQNASIWPNNDNLCI